MNKTMDIIVPWTQRTDRCRANLKYIVSRMEKQPGVGRIIIVESDKKVTGYPSELTDYYYSLKGEANLSWAGNYGFRQSTTEIVAIVNSSLMLPNDAFACALGMNAVGFECGSLLDGFKRYDIDQSNEVMAQPSTLRIKDYYIEGGVIRGGGLFAGAFWLSRKLWIDIRGMNETYYPAGNEDLDMDKRLRATKEFAAKLALRNPKLGVHLYHDNQYKLWRKFKPLILWVRSLSDEGIKDYINNLSIDFGNPDCPQIFWPEELGGSRPFIAECKEDDNV